MSWTVIGPTLQLPIYVNLCIFHWIWQYPWFLVFSFTLKRKSSSCQKENILISFRFLVNTPQGREPVLFFQMYLITEHAPMNVLIEMI